MGSLLAKMLVRMPHASVCQWRDQFWIKLIQSFHGVGRTRGVKFLSQLNQDLASLIRRMPFEQANRTQTIHDRRWG